MKAVPILALTNALALGLALVLYMQQEDLKSQIGATRGSAASRTSAPSEGESLLRERLERLERRLDSREVAAKTPAPVSTDAPGAAASEGRAAAPRDADGAANPPPAPSPQESYDVAEMESFRRKVSLANELNAKEQRVQRVVDDIDRLVSESKIAPLDEKQKKHVASVILEARDKMPTIWTRVRQSVDFQNTPREEMGQIIRAEFQTLRTETQKILEETMPAVDAKTILDESMQERGGFMGGDRGASPRTPGRSNREAREGSEGVGR